MSGCSSSMFVALPFGRTPGLLDPDAPQVGPLSPALSGTPQRAETSVACPDRAQQIWIHRGTTRPLRRVSLGVPIVRAFGGGRVCWPLAFCAVGRQSLYACVDYSITGARAKASRRTVARIVFGAGRRLGPSRLCQGGGHRVVPLGVSLLGPVLVASTTRLCRGGLAVRAAGSAIPIDIWGGPRGG